MTIKERQESLIEEFSLYEDWMDKYSYLNELGKEITLIDEAYKTNQYLISGCQSQVWLHAEYVDGLIKFTADSDAIITKGIAALLLRVFNDSTPKEIVEAKLDFIKEIGLDDHLTPTRSNGLQAMIKQMKLYAKVFDLKGKIGEGKV